MTWCWLARVDGPPKDAWASAALSRGGASAGVLAAWRQGARPIPEAVRMDAQLVDPDGEPAFISFLLLARDRSPLFDDPAVSGALRAVLRGPTPEGVSTFTRDSSHFSGAVTVRRRAPQILRDDPFARLGRPEILQVAAGLFGEVPPVPGPVLQRYAGLPWPAAGF